MNSSLASSEEDPDNWITNLESLRAEIDAVNILGKMTDMDFIIHLWETFQKNIKLQ